jgi:hypothetical protein
MWLQHDPDSTAKSLMERLQHDYPGRFPDVQLRTLQRRIREWREILSNFDGPAKSPKARYAPTCFPGIFAWQCMRKWTFCRPVKFRRAGKKAE